EPGYPRSLSRRSQNEGNDAGDCGGQGIAGPALRPLGGGCGTELTLVPLNNGLGKNCPARYYGNRAVGPHGPATSGLRWAMFHVKKILYPTDFSSYSNQAYFHAVALAETHQASLTILYVYNPEWEDHEDRDPAADRAYWRGQLVHNHPTNSEI